MAGMPDRVGEEEDLSIGCVFLDGVHNRIVTSFIFTHSLGCRIREFVKCHHLLLFGLGEHEWLRIIKRFDKDLRKIPSA